NKPGSLFKISPYHFVLKMICLLFFCTVFFCSCGNSSNLNAKNASNSSAIVGATSFPIQNLPKVSATNQVIQENNAVLDIGNISQGYFLASYSGDQTKRAKLRVVKDDQTYYYDLVYGKADAFPLSLGNGTYEATIFQQIADDRYAAILTNSFSVELKDEFSPFLVSTQYIPFSSDSTAVQKAYELSSDCHSDAEVLSKIYNYIKDHISYDKEKAASLKTIYIPNPDETLSNQKGICYDYASLAAVMLRANGIPTKMIFGYVGKNDLYHAWNMVYLQNAGWISVKFKADSNEWTRIDSTFAASMSDSSLSTFIGDGSHYTNRYIY
ncbi:MAG: transglutaminase-like domain-containing protein, partial [Oscillospiraceae bacterium]|nr:transglutaminase-like domain-containing protein [Oscillospiraceae bacterium]